MSQDPADIAVKILKSHNFAKGLFDEFIKDWEGIQKQQANLEKAGAGATEATTLLRNLKVRYTKLQLELRKLEAAMDKVIK